MDVKKIVEGVSARKLDQVILIVLVGGLLLGVCSYFLPSGASTVANEEVPEAEMEADTIIPQGFVLVPIQLENQQSLLAIMGSHAVLNIYQVDVPGGSRGKLIAKSIKVLRAPFNPEALSVLTPEEKAPLFMGTASGFYGVLQNRSSNELNVTAPKNKKTLPIESFEN